MPLYEILCLAKPTLSRPDLVNVIKRLGDRVLDSGGVITDIKSYGTQLLAYDIHKPFQKYDRAEFWQMNFVLKSELMKDVDRDLKLDDNIIRFVALKRPYFSKSLEELLVDAERHHGPIMASVGDVEKPSP